MRQLPWLLLCCALALSGASEPWADGTASSEDDCQQACYSHETGCSDPAELDMHTNQQLSCYQCCLIRVRGQLNQTECETRDDVGQRTGQSGCDFTLGAYYYGNLCASCSDFGYSGGECVVGCALGATPPPSAPPPTPPPPPSPPPAPPIYPFGGVEFQADQPDPTNTSFAFGADGDGYEVLNTTSTSTHNMWTAREGALMMYAAMPEPPWSLSAQVRFNLNMDHHTCGLTVYGGGDGSVANINHGLMDWGGVCGGDEEGAYGHGVFQVVDAMFSYYSGTALDTSKRTGSICEVSPEDWTWFRLVQAADGEFTASWNSNASAELPLSNWTTMSTFTFSNAPDRIGLYHKTGTDDESICSFRNLVLADATPPPNAPPASPPVPPSPPFEPPSPPWPPQGPRLAEAGDDPILIGGDGQAYEVRGYPGEWLNLLSAERLSLNAQFTEVPARFRAADITDTVLGDVGLALCDEGCTAVLTFNASTGVLHRQVHDHGGMHAHEGGAAAACGFAVDHQRYICDMRSLTCGWQSISAAGDPATAAAAASVNSSSAATFSSSATDHLELPLVSLGHSRLLIAMGALRLNLTRHAMVDVEGDIDCARLRAWPVAAAACERASRAGQAADAQQQQQQQQEVGMAEAEAARLTLLLRAAMAAPLPLPSFTFMQLAVDSLEAAGHSQEALHGLLGQRALLRPPPPAEHGEEEGLVRVGVGASGSRVPTAGFGPQGEGAIEGVVTDYVTDGAHAHGSFRFSKWRGCSLRSEAAASS